MDTRDTPTIAGTIDAVKVWGRAANVQTLSGEGVLDDALLLIGMVWYPVEQYLCDRQDADYVRTVRKKPPYRYSTASPATRKLSGLPIHSGEE